MIQVTCDMCQDTETFLGFTDAKKRTVVIRHKQLFGECASRLDKIIDNLSKLET